MLVSTYTRRKYLRNVSIRNGREAVGDSSRRRGILFFGYFAERHHKGEDTILVVFQIARVIARLNVTKAQRGAIGKPQRVDSRRDIFAKRHQASFPARLYARFVQLLGK